MKPFTPGKRVSRVVKIKSCDRALADGEFILTFSENGLSVRRRGARKTDGLNLSWRSIVGHVLIHKGM
jgi:hypothetical protein